MCGASAAPTSRRIATRIRTSSPTSRSASSAANRRSAKSTFPPNGRLDVHSHPNDTLYVIRSGEFHIEGEGVFRPGDVRWVRGGLTYGPEWAGPEGAVLLIVALNGAFGTTWVT